MKNVYTVWVGGVEVVDHYVDFLTAIDIQEYYFNRGYDDVVICKAQ